MTGQDTRHPRTFDHASFDIADLAGPRPATVSVCMPARNEAATISRNVAELLPLLEARAIDQLVIVDDSDDGTGELAAAAGAEVYDQSSLRSELGPVAGKGDAMWRALSVLHGEIVCFLDADSEDLGPHFVQGLVGPLLMWPELAFVKASYRRPFRVGATTLQEGGGRVNELMARPLLDAFYPELAGFRQPLAGEFAARRSLLDQLPFVCGYGVEIAMLIDAAREAGPRALAQADLDVRQNRHRPLHELGPMAQAVLHAVRTRLAREGRLDLMQASTSPAAAERPALADMERAEAAELTA